MEYRLHPSHARPVIRFSARYRRKARAESRQSNLKAPATQREKGGIFILPSSAGYTRFHRSVCIRPLLLSLFSHFSLEKPLDMLIPLIPMSRVSRLDFFAETFTPLR